MSKGTTNLKSDQDHKRSPCLWHFWILYFATYHLISSWWYYIPMFILFYFIVLCVRMFCLYIYSCLVPKRGVGSPETCYKYLWAIMWVQEIEPRASLEEWPVLLTMEPSLLPLLLGTLILCFSLDSLNPIGVLNIRQTLICLFPPRLYQRKNILLNWEKENYDTHLSPHRMDMKPVMSTSWENLTDIFTLAFMPFVSLCNNEPKNNIPTRGDDRHTPL